MIHVILPPRGRPTECAFVQRTKSLCRMLAMLGEDHTEHQADETFTVDEGDLVFYSFPEQPVVAPGTIPIECGVGYILRPWGAYRVYESQAWRHFDFGRFTGDIDVPHRRWSWVIPWAFDPDEWPLGTGSGGYVSMLTRLQPDKGLALVDELARLRPDIWFKIAGVGDDGPWRNLPKNVELVGPIHGSARAEFLGRAIVHLVPTDYVEPFGGVAVEAMLCGTPVITSTYGGLIEIVTTSSGSHVRSAEEASRAVNVCSLLPREAVRRSAKYRFSLEAIAEVWKRELPAMKKLPRWNTMPAEPIARGPVCRPETLKRLSAGIARNITRDPPPEDVTNGS